MNTEIYAGVKDVSPISYEYLETGYPYHSGNTFRNKSKQRKTPPEHPYLLCSDRIHPDE